MTRYETCIASALMLLSAVCWAEDVVPLPVTLSAPGKLLTLDAGRAAGSATVEVINDSQWPVVVSVARKSCGCLAVVLPEAAVQAHARAPVTVTITPGDEAGERTELVALKVTAISPAQQAVVLPFQLKLTVPAIAQATPPRLRWKAGEGGGKVVTIATLVPGTAIAAYHADGDGFTIVKDQSSTKASQAIVTIARDASVPTTGGALLVTLDVGNGRTSTLIVHLIADDAKDSEEEAPTPTPQPTSAPATKP